MPGQKQSSKHGRKDSLTNLGHRIRHPHGGSSSQQQQDTGVHVEDDVLVDSQSRTGADHLGYEVDVHSDKHSVLVRAALQRRQQQRASAAAPLQPLANDDCARLFPLKCSKDTWRRLLADFPDEKAALVALGHKS
ncbi:hypothetical protein E4U23_007999 [Claviceps purpurea]|nr:hypothetical protein E4U12_007426 [Claviceps purpurea]KAG6136871.1 hypothetical protein E4U28_004836 [Claviceps purpurea]KAG6167754.1 hypothetical protein E4U51_002672 [Claviceps purpurea]KAG6228703.1 hypothetical protein E4U26_000800 [Claviceps purpurea]KAG6253224.1 hypothetical protein E4U23_007999 [Claviceps purpurea]